MSRRALSAEQAGSRHGLCCCYDSHLSLTIRIASEPFSGWQFCAYLSQRPIRPRTRTRLDGPDDVAEPDASSRASYVVAGTDVCPRINSHWPGHDRLRIGSPGTSMWSVHLIRPKSWQSRRRSDDVIVAFGTTTDRLIARAMAMVWSGIWWPPLRCWRSATRLR
jgi:hypothetical protein